MKSFKNFIRCIFLGSLMLGLNACYVKHSEQYYQYAPDMHFAPSLKAQEPGAMRPPVKGTVSRNFRAYNIKTLEQARGHLNPLPRSKASLEKGRELYNVYCIVCHGKSGEGDGTVAALQNWPRPLFPRPPTLQSDRVRDFKDGEVFHIMTLGQNTMPSYADKLESDERWSIVHYVRALYRSKHPSAEDLKKSETYFDESIE